MAAATWTVTHARITEEIVRGKRLGRHVHHDSRSWNYRYTAPPGMTLLSVGWIRRIPILDQGNVGSCTGNALTGALGTDPDWGDLPSGHPVMDEAEALAIYSAAETIDGDGPYPPNDNGSSGLSVCKAAVAAGLISGYQNTFSLADALAALQNGSVISGFSWYDSMDTPDSAGLVAISPGAVVRGGHEVEARRLDVDRQLVGFDNSWGTSWGDNGSFWMSWATWDRLLSEQGDVTVPVPLSQPAPVPVPPEPVPVPVPVPADITFATDSRMLDWAGRHHTGDNKYAAQTYGRWAAGVRGANG